MKKRLGQRLREIFSFGSGSDEFWEELEDSLIEADLGAQFTMELTERLQKSARVKSREELEAALRAMIEAEVHAADPGLDRERLNVVLVLGVNGVGKTTNLAKIAWRYQREWPDSGIVMAAGDTFRAAAVEQLTLHAERLGVRIVKQQTGADAASVVYDAIDSARSNGDRLLLADTAGRMHNRTDLVRELEKIHGIIERRAGADVVYRKYLVVDAMTGQNALRQAELFHEAVGVDGVILSKYDSSSRGGILVPMARQLGLRCIWMGTGEQYADLTPFDPHRFAEELVTA